MFKQSLIIIKCPRLNEPIESVLRGSELKVHYQTQLQNSNSISILIKISKSKKKYLKYNRM